MATVVCTTSDGKTSYTCTGGTANGCARAIAQLKAIDAGKQDSPSNLPISSVKLLDVSSGNNDSVVVGVRKFAVEEYDIIVAEMNDDVVEVIVFKEEKLFFRGKRPKRLVNFVKDNSSSAPLMESFEQEEDFVLLDTKYLEEYFFKKLTR
jgi:hypothetical protein